MMLLQLKTPYMGAQKNMVAIQKNLDGSFPGLKLKEIFEIEPAAKALFNKCVAWGLENPLEDAAKFLEREIKPTLLKLAGWNARKEELSATETFETLAKALHEAANCWMYYNRIRKNSWAYSAFKAKFGAAPRFNPRKLGAMAA